MIEKSWKKYEERPVHSLITFAALQQDAIVVVVVVVVGNKGGETTSALGSKPGVAGKFKVR
jgi:hypothetical protein